MLRLYIGRVAVLAGLAVVIFGQSGPSQAAGKESAPPVSGVSVRDGLLTVNVRNAPLPEVLRLVAKFAKFEVHIADDVRGVVTASFTDVPLRDGIGRLVRGYSVVLTALAPNDDGDALRLTQLRVYKAGSSAPLPSSPLAHALPEARSPRVMPEIETGRSFSAAMPASAAEGVPVRTQSVFNADEANLSAFGNALSSLSDAEVRQDIVIALKEIGGPQAAGFLANALRDEDASVRREAVAGLSAVGGPDSRSALLSALRQDPEPQLRVEAARALALYRRDEEVGKALAAAASDPDNAVRQIVAEIRSDLTPGTATTSKALLRRRTR
jgi:hypothetical protein